MNAEELKIGDRVYVQSIDNFGGPAIVIDTRDTPGGRCRVLMDDGNPPPFWAFDQELHDPEPREGYDSRPETLAHIEEVRGRLGRVIADLKRRAADHDLSKLLSPEREIFDEYSPKLRDVTYGSEEYRTYLAAMKPALVHHYAANSHHPEHYRWQCPICELQVNDAAREAAPQGPNESGVRYCPRCCRDGMIYESELINSPEWGIQGMSLVDLVEMLVDWKAASLRHTTGDIRRSIEINQERFGYSDELKQILLNTLPMIEGSG